MEKRKRRYIRKSTDFSDVLEWLPNLPGRFWYLQVATVNGFDRKYITGGWTIYYDSREFLCSVTYHQSLTNESGTGTYDLMRALLKSAWKLAEFWENYQEEDHYRLAESSARLYAEGKGLLSRKQEVAELMRPYPIVPYPDGT